MNRVFLLTDMQILDPRWTNIGIILKIQKFTEFIMTLFGVILHLAIQARENAMHSKEEEETGTKK